MKVPTLRAKCSGVQQQQGSQTGTLWTGPLSPNTLNFSGAMPAMHRAVTCIAGSIPNVAQLDIEET